MQTSLRERKAADDDDKVPYFVLGDVWESFAEWSAYGAGVHLVLNNKDRVIQYYVPSLSGIQIYADPHALSSSLKARRLCDDSSSDVSTDSDSERVAAGIDHVSLRDQLLEDSSSDDGERLGSQGRLMFEYLERDLPYIREPLADKVSDLAARFPELKTLRSCDLLPSSWFSVAWYPIYKIPTGPTVKDLDACFLTYHSLHTPVAEAVTPSVPAQYSPKTSLRERKAADDDDKVPYFVLGDVWESFAEWSAYGAGVHLVLNNKDRVIQYYVPSLSGIQIYADPHALSSSLKARRLSDDSSSDVSTDSDSERVTAGMDHVSLRDQLLEDSSSDDGERLGSQGRLMFEYLERDLPYIREPLADKVSDLAARFPELKTLRSCDLLPSSWFSVAWYPIYKIPTGPTVKDLDACFLTYHSLHTPVAGKTKLSFC
ncbi:hypothetical protein F2Q69_00024168 [Brassica cretica]|uniref:Uncharacterized protein n=1 Tax=Brassica cretica TaxID=69181 RepID=A0A8S9QT27_BRACR|nr:hypothetical protein F2Q69_00024168 [Brassica cretica]